MWVAFMKNHKMYMGVIYMKMQKIVSQFILGVFLPVYGKEL